MTKIHEIIESIEEKKKEERRTGYSQRSGTGK